MRLGWTVSAFLATAAWGGLVPLPQEMKTGEGRFAVGAGTPVVCETGVAAKAAGAAEAFGRAFGTRRPASAGKRAKGTVVFAEGGEALGREGYRLEAAPDGIVVSAHDAPGFFYGVQTLRQLAKDGAVPCVTIRDRPVFRWRGLHLDTSRHFFAKEEVERILDIMGQYKLNVLHWHFIDGQSCSLQFLRHPELTKDRGRFFLQSDAREIIAYAAARHITVVPEIEEPAHANTVVAVYPRLGCKPGADVLCAGNDEAVRFIKDLLDETCEMFPSTYIHIGGDECNKANWKACPKCQARIKALGLKDEEALQSWFVRQFAEYLETKGRHALGWEEIMQGGELPEGAAVMSWLGRDSALKATAQGRFVVFAPTNPWYFDYRQFAKPDGQNYWEMGKVNSIDKVYAFDPLAGIPEARRAYILGGQANNWTELSETNAQLEWKMFPRALALAEVLWTAPAKRDIDAFGARLAPHIEALRKSGINCAPFRQ
jgi:hexosaminidase